MFCHPESSETVLTVVGANFGSSGARVSLAETTGPRRWECEAVQHVSGNAEAALRCAGLGWLEGVAQGRGGLQRGGVGLPYSVIKTVRCD